MAYNRFPGPKIAFKAIFEGQNLANVLIPRKISWCDPERSERTESPSEVEGPEGPPKEGPPESESARSVLPLFKLYAL